DRRIGGVRGRCIRPRGSFRRRPACPVTEPTSETAEVTDWATLSERSWPVLLIGNGMSVNLWNGFSYPSLHELAMLSPAATAVFDEIQTTNFEAALEVIHHAHVVAVALGRDTREIDETYEAVKT